LDHTYWACAVRLSLTPPQHCVFFSFRLENLNYQCQARRRVSPRLQIWILLEMKLSGYIGAPWSRAKDLADVVELVKAKDPRDFELDADVVMEFDRVWDELENETTTRRPR
jgi:hypothetical protein